MRFRNRRAREQISRVREPSSCARAFSQGLDCSEKIAEYVSMMRLSGVVFGVPDWGQRKTRRNEQLAWSCLSYGCIEERREKAG